MAKLVYVPDWLDSEKANLPLKNLSSILSKYDIINHANAQIEFYKLLVSELTQDKDEFIRGYNSTMQLNTSEFPDESLVYLHDNFDAPIKVESILGSYDNLSVCKFTITITPDGNTIYFTNTVVDNNPLVSKEKLVVSASPRDIIKGALNKTYNGFRVLNEQTDKSSAFRENRFLTQLYVKMAIAIA